MRYLPNTKTSQAGTTLIVAMIILLVLTILGVTTMNTTSLQERMAHNTQETNRAFNAAETGLETAFSNMANFSLATSNANSGTLNAGAYTSGANFTTTFRQCTPPQRSPVGCDVDNCGAWHFDTQSTGFSDATDPGGGADLVQQPNSAQVVLNGGFFQYWIPCPGS